MFCARSCPSPENSGARQCDSSPRKVTLSLSSLWFSNTVWSECNFSPVLWELLPVMLYIMKTSKLEAIFNFCSEVGHPAVSGPQLRCLAPFFPLAIFLFFFVVRWSFHRGQSPPHGFTLFVVQPQPSKLGPQRCHTPGGTVSLLRYDRHG